MSVSPDLSDCVIPFTFILQYAIPLLSENCLTVKKEFILPHLPCSNATILDKTVAKIMLLRPARTPTQLLLSPFH